SPSKDGHRPDLRRDRIALDGEDAGERSPDGDRDEEGEPVGRVDDDGRREISDGRARHQPGDRLYEGDTESDACRQAWASVPALPRERERGPRRGRDDAEQQPVDLPPDIERERGAERIAQEAR